MPIRMFWKLMDEIDRLRAEELSDLLPVHMVAMGGGARELSESLQRRIGKPLVFENTGSLSDESRAKLRNMFG